MPKADHHHWQHAGTITNTCAFTDYDAKLPQNFFTEVKTFIFNNIFEFFPIFSLAVAKQALPSLKHGYFQGLTAFAADPFHPVHHPSAPDKGAQSQGHLPGGTFIAAITRNISDWKLR
jgi:hypothetical protein